jgi:hypothetical protein
LIVMVAAPASVRVPKKFEMIGVMGVNEAVTRTEMTLPGAWKEQLDPVQAPVGGVPAGGAWTHAMCAAPTAPKGDIIRFAALVMCDSSAASFAGQTGPPAFPQAGSVEPR